MLSYAKSLRGKAGRLVLGNDTLLGTLAQGSRYTAWAASFHRGDEVINFAPINF
jgi:hypothetical protein